MVGLVLEGVPDNVLSGGEGRGTGGSSPILRMYRSNTAAQMVGMMVVDAFIGIEHHPGGQKILSFAEFLRKPVRRYPQTLRRSNLFQLWKLSVL